MSITNRYEFMFYVQCINGNPNGDPDMGNAPRMDPEDMHGYITDGAIKRRIRNYIQTAFEGKPGMGIIMQNATNINKFIAKSKETAGVDFGAKDPESIYKSRKQACAMFYDVRTFGAVMSTGPNAGQVRGPVQIAFAKSLDPILPLDISITRMCKTDAVPGAKSSEDYEKAEQKADVETLRTMGRKQFISYGLYEVRGFISANLAAETGFDDDDLKQSLICMNMTIQQAKVKCQLYHRLLFLSTSEPIQIPNREHVRQSLAVVLHINCLNWSM